jgi:hypothetical protein
MGKKFLIFASVLLFISCGNSSKTFYNELKITIANAEKLVNDHDAAVLNALKKNMPDTITPMTKVVLFSLIKEEDRIKAMAAPSGGEKLKRTAGEYVGTLIDFVKAQDLYANYSSGLSEKQAETMDKASLKALAKVESMRTKLSDYQKAFAKERGFHQ